MKKVLKNRKGFTLIELLAVIVILAVIMLVASTSVSGVMKSAKQGVFRNEFLSLLESAQIKASLDQMNGVAELKGNSGTICYSIANIDQFSKKNEYVGSVLVTKENGTFTFKGWMSNGEFQITALNGSLKSTDVADYSGTDSPTNCNQT